MEDPEVVEETDTGAPPEEAAKVSNLNEDPNTNSETANPESSYTGSHISEKDTHEVNANETMGGAGLLQLTVKSSFWTQLQHDHRQLPTTAQGSNTITSRGRSDNSHIQGMEEHLDCSLGAGHQPSLLHA